MSSSSVVELEAIVVSERMKEELNISVADILSLELLHSSLCLLFSEEEDDSFSGSLTVRSFSDYDGFRVHLVLLEELNDPFLLDIVRETSQSDHDSILLIEVRELELLPLLSLLGRFRGVVPISIRTLLNSDLIVLEVSVVKGEDGLEMLSLVDLDHSGGLTSELVDLDLFKPIWDLS